MKQEIHTKINWLSRSEIVELLESRGFAVLDFERTDDLRDVIRTEVEAGEMTLTE